LLPPERLTRACARAAAPAVELVDLGAPFQVVVGGRVREYRDEARDCAQRARVAAVFVAMTIDPASIAAPPPPPPPPPPAAAPGAPPGARLGVAAAVDSGLGSSGVVVQGGLDLRLAAGRRRSRSSPARCCCGRSTPPSAACACTRRDSRSTPASASSGRRAAARPTPISGCTRASCR
jgi:hypothetical protein